MWMIDMTKADQSDVGMLEYSCSQGVLLVVQLTSSTCWCFCSRCIKSGAGSFMDRDQAGLHSREGKGDERTSAKTWMYVSDPWKDWQGLLLGLQLCHHLVKVQTTVCILREIHWLPVYSFRTDTVLGAAALSSRQCIACYEKDSQRILAFCPGKHLLAVNLVTGGDDPFEPKTRESQSELVHVTITKSIKRKS